jgi:putative endonuclease
MPFYVYIIQSLKDESYYKGFSEHPLLRLNQHNNKESDYTSRKTPWVLVYVEIMESKSAAIIRERNLKKAAVERIKALLTHPKNIVVQITAG